jgi:hypothetical protein
MTLLYTTHALIETLNLGVTVYVVSLAQHMVLTACRALYTLSLYVEMVWLLIPSAVVSMLMARVVAVQCTEEELVAVSTSLT